MKILYIACSCSPDYGSEDTVGWNIPLQATKSGHEVYIIVRSGTKKVIEKWMEKNTFENMPRFFYIETSTLLKKMAKGPFFTLRLYEFSSKAYKVAKKLCQVHSIDIIHQITPVEFRSIGNYGNIPNTKFIIGPIAGGQKINRLLWRYAGNKVIEHIRVLMNNLIIRSKQYRKKIEKADEILFANYETKEMFLKYSLVDENCTVIPEIGISKENKLKSYKREPVVFLLVGRLIPIKGIDIVLDALRYLNEENFVIRVCGEGKLKTKIKKRIEKEELNGKVELVGFVNYHKMQEEYKNATALLMPSLREATGTVLVEAMSNNIPVVTFEQFGAKLIIDNDSGWLIPLEETTEKSIQNFADVMKKIIDNPQCAMQKGENAGKRIKRYTWDKKFQFYEDIYIRLKEDKYEI